MARWIGKVLFVCAWWLTLDLVFRFRVPETIIEHLCLLGLIISFMLAGLFEIALDIFGCFHIGAEGSKKC